VKTGSIETLYRRINLILVNILEYSIITDTRHAVHNTGELNIALLTYSEYSTASTLQMNAKEDRGLGLYHHQATLIQASLYLPLRVYDTCGWQVHGAILLSTDLA